MSFAVRIRGVVDGILTKTGNSLREGAVLSGMQIDAPGHDRPAPRQRPPASCSRSVLAQSTAEPTISLMTDGRRRDAQPLPCPIAGARLGSRGRSARVARHPARQSLCRFPACGQDRLVTGRASLRCSRPSPLDSGAPTKSRWWKVLNEHHDGVPADAVHVGRGSRWGNPFRIGADGDRAAVVARHGAWLRDQHALPRALCELRGKDLVCFCAPTACHGDLQRWLANGSRADLIAWWRAGRQ